MEKMLRWITTIITQSSKNSRQKNGRVAITVKASATGPDDFQTTTIQELAGMTEDENVIEIGKILAAWNPLGDVEAAAIGLSDYQAEAIDILSVMQLYEYSAKKATSEVLQEAFLIDLEKTELDHYGSKIEAGLAKK